MTTNTVKINGVDFSDIVEHNSYHTERIPVRRKVTTIDGVDHLVQIREKGFLTFGTNPITQERYTELCNQLQSGSCSVQYTNLQTGTVLIEEMEYDKKTADFIGNCNFLSKKWIERTVITFTQL